MPLRLADLTLVSPVALAPMAGITDLPFRRLVARFGAGLVVSEMVASREMVAANRSARTRADLGFGEARTAVQIVGCEAYWMAEAARMAEAGGARLIDINMGCPARKVVGGLAGSALLRDLDHALSLIEAVVAAVSIPVTLKTRLGWDSKTFTAGELARRAEGAGVAMISVHGRTRCQFYKGHADWRAIRAVVEAVSIPVIANGDITDAASAVRALRMSAAAGVMIGRGAQGRPWLLAEVAAALAGERMPARPEGGELFDLVAEHHQMMLSHYGKALGLRVARKHLGWYLDTVSAPPDLRRAILTAGSPDMVLHHLAEAIEARPEVAA